MAPTLVLLAQTRAGTGLVTAGVLSALQAITAALSQPVLARVADRYGHRTVLTASTAATTLVFLLLAAMPASEFLTGILVALSGLLAPPVQSCLRGRWTTLVPDHAIGCAHALDSSLSEILYIAAPLTTAAAVYGTGPASGYLLAAGLGVIGTAVLSVAPSVPATRSTWARHSLGPLRSADLLWIMSIHACLGASVGTVTLAGLLVSTHSGQPSTSGLVPALYAVDALVGGLIFGARRWPGTPARRLVIGFVLMAVSWLPAAACSTPWGAALAAIVPGAAMTPTLVCGSDLRHEHVIDGQAEASGWVIAATGFGRAIGVALASHWPTTWWPAVYAACALPTAALWLHRPRTRSRPVSRTP
ncbi:MFS transporter [Kitasatospora sp. NPDC058190]|uniref:MFS transporter n=1 Tax=Kitasatospora sp. NPDC058190 TaxID=3346371 RepID=UPI0036DB1703